MKWVILVFCLGIGTVCSYYGFKLFGFYRSIGRWPKISARVLSKAIVPKKLPGNTRANKKLSITYEYDYDGKAYQGANVFIVDLLNGERGFYQKPAEEFLEKIGSTAEIFVDSEDPKRSVMFCDSPALYLFMIVAGIVMILAGLISLAM